MSQLAIHGGRPVRHKPFPSFLEPAGRTFGAEEREAVLDVLDGAVLNSSSGGIWAPELERTMAEMHGARHGVACTSGTAALHLAVAAIDPEPGDEIITTPLTDMGTIIAIIAQNAVPVFADVDPLTGNLDPRSVGALVSDRTRAILPVHLFGRSAPLGELKKIADQHSASLIEDCAQAYLSMPDDSETPVGSHGAVGCFSLQQHKHITAGDGGVVVTSDDELAVRLRLLVDKGCSRADGRWHPFLGFNYRMNNLTAAVALAQLRRLSDVVQRRRALARRLLDRLGNLPGLHLPDDSERHSFWILPFVLDDAAPGLNRAWAEALTGEGVPALAGWLPVPVYLQAALQKPHTYGRSGFPLRRPPARRDWEYPEGLCPEAERLVNSSLVVMPWNERYTEDDVDDIAEAMLKVHAVMGTDR